MSTRVLGAGRHRLEADRVQVGERLVQAVSKRLAELGAEEGFDCEALASTTQALLDRLHALDLRLADHSAATDGGPASPTGELRSARKTMTTLVWALAILPAGQPEAATLLRDGIERQLTRISRARRELDNQIR